MNQVKNRYKMAPILLMVGLVVLIGTQSADCGLFEDLFGAEQTKTLKVGVGIDVDLEDFQTINSMDIKVTAGGISQYGTTDHNGHPLTVVSFAGMPLESQSVQVQVSGFINSSRSPLTLIHCEGLSSTQTTAYDQEEIYFSAVKVNCNSNTLPHLRTPTIMDNLNNYINNSIYNTIGY